MAAKVSHNGMRCGEYRTSQLNAEVAPVEETKNKKVLTHWSKGPGGYRSSTADGPLSR